MASLFSNAYYCLCYLYDPVVQILQTSGYYCLDYLSVLGHSFLLAGNRLENSFLLSGISKYKITRTVETFF